MNSSFEELKTIAGNFVNLLLKADFKSATGRFDDQMKIALNESKLEETWINLIAEAGSLLQLNPPHTTETKGNKIIIIRCDFQRAIIDIQIVFNEQGQISGLNFIPTETEYHAPDYANKSAFHERDVTVGEGKWALTGTLTVPDGSGPFPGLVLVHGSGPNDRDETVGPNRPFKDLAWGLASNGIAVLRYDKRTFKHTKQFTPDQIENITVKEEVIDDALLAINLMRETEVIDPKRVFYLGHSLGATLAPRIGQQDNELAGIIIMAGITRSIEETILDQYTYLYNLNGKITEEQKAELVTLKGKVDKLKDPEFIENISRQDLPLEMPVAYWKDLHDHNPLTIVKTLNIPILILQGGRDYQVLESKDFKGWKDALNQRENVEFKLFPRLNHLFIEGEGKSTPQEYLVEGHVDEKVIKTIAPWIRKV
ncbi:MAG: Alpha/beta hydrolase family protein [Methanobacterium sp. PtaU1.Bin242]|nr:MAG: Alpha/beta hydrolase family protein [Methanobacterium sp. PtaU1.Bin242]